MENTIKNFKTENDYIQKKFEICRSDSSNEIHHLVKEIEQVQKINQKKEDHLIEIEKEKEKVQLKEKLIELEKEKDALEDKIVKEETGSKFVTNMSDELEILDQRAHNVSPDENMKSPTHLKNHIGYVHDGSLVKKIWKLKVMQLEQSISSQKLKLASDILNLKEKEASRNQFCTCKTFWSLVHQKHNWKRSVSQDILNKFRLLENSYTCNCCDITFQNVDCLNLHVRRVHEENFVREAHNGGVIVRNPSITSGGRLL